jgi:hypothetical protein
LADTRTLRPTSPGLATILGARVLGEFGDDPHWYVSANGRKIYGGTSPITRASGKKSAALGLLTRTLTERERSQGARHAQTMATRAQLAVPSLPPPSSRPAGSSGWFPPASGCWPTGRGYSAATIRTSSPARASLAGACQASGKMPLAVELAVRAAAGSERVLGADHADTLARRVRLANLHYSAGRVGDAEALLRDALARCERVLPPADPRGK